MTRRRGIKVCGCAGVFGMGTWEVGTSGSQHEWAEMGTVAIGASHSCSTWPHGGGGAVLGRGRSAVTWMGVGHERPWGAEICSAHF